MSDITKLPLAETVFTNEELSAPTERDRIVVLGRRASGKTVYLSVLYERYWKSLAGVTMKAVSGNVHSGLMRTVEGLRSGRWPPATLETQHCDLEIDYKNRKHLLVALDYAGELFRKAFVEDATQTPETEALVKHIDSAAAVILLVDPQIAVGGSVDARIDDDFGMTQAVARIRNWPGGRSIPFVLVFTKADQNAELIHREGGVEQFVIKHFPALARTLQKIQIFQIAAVQAEIQPDGNTTPKKEFHPSNIERPLLYCLDQIDLRLEVAEHETMQREQQLVTAQRLKSEERSAKRTQNIIVAIMVSMVVVAACIITLILVINS